ncbi:MAG TPA: SgcJ/EcaC family oxidoreductase [Burkholderiaceae bacterium]|nr:SgcJ/EcaC family oxidoreductase [Burkholderiaceae bacterium]
MQRPHPTAEAAERAFYAAMADGDLERMMALWADDDAAVCNHPGGPRLIGRHAIEEAFREIFSSGGVRIATAAVQAWRNADVAVHSLIERIAVEGRGGTEVVEVVATNVYVRGRGGWRILVHHAGVSESDEADDEDEDDDEEPADASDDASVWTRARLAAERAPDADDPEDDGEPGRPPRGRLH